MPTLTHRPPSRLSQLSDADADLDLDLDLEQKDEQLHLEDAVPGARERETSQYSAADEAFLASFDDKRRAHMYRKIDVRLLPMLALLYLFACEWCMLRRRARRSRK